MRDKLGPPKSRHRSLLFITLFAQLTVFLFSPTIASATSDSYETIEWVQLIPEDDLQALMNPPEYIAGIADGSAADSIQDFQQQDSLDETATRFQQALKSAKVIDTYNEKTVRIPGFIVPLEYRKDQTVISFFIVPYFGACLHMPPPPPNQMIYGQFEKGVEVDELYNAFWFEGTMKTGMHEDYLGTSAYQMTLDNVEPYDE